MSAAGPPTAASGSPPPTTLPKIDRSGVIAEPPLRAAEPDAESRDDLVAHQQRAVLRAPLAQAGEEAVGRGDETHVGGDRLDEDRGDVGAVLGQHASSASRSL